MKNTNQPIPVDIAAALHELGVEGVITVRLDIYYKVDEVSVNGQYFGLWDRQKQCFVD